MRTTISNVITIEEPSDELKQYVRDNLELPNPEYEKKLRMGFWVGRTPKKLRLYEWHGNSLILPFGLCRDILPMIRSGEVLTGFTEPEKVDYGKPLPLYDYQQEAVDRMAGLKYGILKAPAGSGKTQCGIAMISQIGTKALWLCAKHDLLKQSYDRAKQYMDEDLFGTITEGKVNVGKGITFSTVQTLANTDLNRYRNEWDTIIVDECFPYNTLIDTNKGLKRISDIRKGDYVWTTDNEMNLSLQKVEKVFVKIPFSLIKITLRNNNIIYCTSNHPILTERGYISAGEITSGDAVCCLRENGGSENIQQFDKVCIKKRKRTCLLFRRMQKQGTELLVSGETGTSQEEFDCCKQNIRIKADERKQSNVKRKDCRNCQESHERDRAQTVHTWRERNRAISSAKENDGCVKPLQSNRRVCNPNKNRAWKWISNMLQSRSCNSRDENCYRSGWRISPLTEGPTNRQEKDGTFKWIGVDSVKVQKQTSDGTFGGLCPDGRVYNLEVRNNHNYFANGVNVHNCHNIGVSATTVTRYQKVLNNLAARHKYGLSATPDRADGLIKATFALIGNVVYEVPEAAVADKIMKVTVRPVTTYAEVTDDCLNVDGTLNYTKLIEHLTTDAERNKQIARAIMEENGHSCLILSSRLAHLEAMRNLLPYEMQEKSAMISGKMTSKKDKVLREEIMDKMRSGELLYLFASYSISREGLDIPRLDRLFMATPEKFSSVIIQSIGRIARTFPGKEKPIAFDFVDDQIGFCKRAYKERCKHYRKAGAEIREGFL